MIDKRTRHPGESRDPGSQHPEKNWAPAFAGATFCLLAFAHIYLGWGPIKSFSPTYDEPVHLTAGYVYWRTGDYAYNGLHHPPLGEMISGLPLLFMKPMIPVQHPAWLRGSWSPVDQYMFADTFLYKNRVPADAMMRRGRAMQLVLSCLMGAGMAATAFFLAGPGAAMLAAVLWAFFPGFLTAGSLVTTDLAFAVFYFGFFACSLRRNSWRMAVGAGVCLGLCFASKYFALALLPSIVAVELWRSVISKETRGPREWVFWAVVLVVGFFSLALVYRFSGLEVFFAGLSEIFSRSQAGRSSFFWGEHGTQGWLGYFPFVFLVKTPLPILLLLAAALMAVALKKVKIPAALWIPPLAFFALACVSKVQIGHRHLLSLYPFLLVIAAVGADQLVGRRKWLIAPLTLWLVAGTWMVKPDFIAYFNELVGGPAHGYKYLTDSNLDWGQGLKQLSEALPEAEKSRGIYLSYFGVADPHAHGLSYLDVGSDRIVPRTDDTALGIRPKYFAVSVTNLQSTYYGDKTVFAWLKDYQPVQTIGHSIFLYDFSNTPEAINHLERLRR